MFVSLTSQLDLNKWKRFKGRHLIDGIGIEIILFFIVRPPDKLERN